MLASGHVIHSPLNSPSPSPVQSQASHRQSGSPPPPLGAPSPLRPQQQDKNNARQAGSRCASSGTLKISSKNNKSQGCPRGDFQLADSASSPAQKAPGSSLPVSQGCHAALFASSRAPQEGERGTPALDLTVLSPVFLFCPVLL